MYDGNINLFFSLLLLFFFDKTESMDQKLSRIQGRREGRTIVKREHKYSSRESIGVSNRVALIS